MLRSGVRRVVLIASAVVVAAGCGAWEFAQSGPPGEGGTGHAVAAVPSDLTGPQPLAPKHYARPAPTPPPAPPWQPTWIATLTAGTRYSASPGGPAAGALEATNPFGQQQVLAVVGQPDPSGWVKVELPVRPNGSVGYIPAAGVTLSQTSYHVNIDVANHTLTVLDGSNVVAAVPAAVGKPSTPTPLGQTFLWELIRPDNPSGAYGPYIFGLGMFSDTYSVFNGGDAQIGIHGQDEAWSVGHPVSHGCVRLANNVIAQLATMLPLGTPVTIS